MFGYLNDHHGRTDAEPDTSSLLDGSETTCSKWIEQTPQQIRLHASNMQVRQDLARTIYYSNSERLWKRSNRMMLCGVGAVITLDAAGRAGVRVNWCRDRACPTCASKRSREVAERVEKVIEGLTNARMITLTLRADAGSLKDRLDRLLSCFRRLRKEPQWQEAVSGGIYTVEVTRGSGGHHWHVHLHALVYGRYLAHPVLKRLWSSITGDSHVVHVRAIESSAKAAWYVAKYATKPTELLSWSDVAIIEWLETMHGRRLVSVIGECHGWKESGEESDDRVPHLGDITSVARVRLLAWVGFRPACELLSMVGRLPGLWRCITESDPANTVGSADDADSLLQLIAKHAESCVTPEADRAISDHYRNLDRPPPTRKLRRSARHPDAELF